MKKYMIAMACCITMAAMLAYAQDDGFQMATVATIEKLANDGKSSGDLDRYKISMRMGDVVYVCRANAPASNFMEWVSGKQFPAKESGKLLLVKNPNGQIVQLDIASKKKPR